MSFLFILVLAFIQNVSFSLVSRSRNRDHTGYLISASVFSNVIWFLCMRELITADMPLVMLIPYCIGTVAGTVYGAKLSMRIEKFLGATSDGHLKESVK